MEAAQESANAESKSSAGDKYETGRACMASGVRFGVVMQLLINSFALSQKPHN